MRMVTVVSFNFAGRAHRPRDERIYPMRIAPSIYDLFRKPIAFFAPSSPSISEQQSPRPILIGRKELQSNWPRLRMRVLHRDRSRCRGCDKKGDEVTLCIHLIRPDASGMDAIVTLCIKCSDLAIENGLESDVIPHFLRHLWRHLHHPEKTLGFPSTVSGPMKRTVEKNVDPSISRPAWKGETCSTVHITST